MIPLALIAAFVALHLAAEWADHKANKEELW